MLPPLEKPPARSSINDPRALGSDLIDSQKKNKSGKFGRAFILLAVVLLIGWGMWRILPYIPGIPQDVRLKSAEYIRSPHVYRYDTAAYNPDQAPLSPEWVKLIIDKKNNQANFESSTGEQVSVSLGESEWIEACENQFRVEALPLPDGLTLGSTTFQNPMLIMVCDMWAVGEKIRPARIVLMERSILENNPFYMGMECKPKQGLCMSFAEVLIELAVRVVDVDTKQVLPTAQITISSGMGLQEFTGSFRIPVYTAMQVEYQISMPGYAEKIGEISNFYGNKMEIMYFDSSDRTHGMSDSFDLEEYDKEVEYNIELSKE